MVGLVFGWTIERLEERTTEKPGAKVSQKFAHYEHFSIEPTYEQSKMAKKRGAVLRAKKRADEAAAELLDQTIENQESSKFEAKDDSELFVLDTKADIGVTGLGNKKRKPVAISTELNVKQGKKNRISEQDGRQIRKIMSNHSNEAVVSLAAANEVRTVHAKRVLRIAGTAKASFDLWDETAPENEETRVLPFITGVASQGGTAPMQFHTVTKSSLRKDMQQPSILSKKQMKARRQYEAKAKQTIRVEPAQPGQSYRPDEEQHQDVIGEALAIELRRKEAVDYRNAPLGGGMQAETLALIVGDSDDESSDEEDEGGDDDDDDTNARHKRKEKMTKAQRNKQKRVKADRLALEERRRKKQLLNQFDLSKKVSKEVRKEEAAKVARREEINALIAEKEAQPLGGNVIEKLSEMDPINAPSLPVALTDELKDGSLRTVKPKGSLLTDRMESMISRKMANRKAISAKQRVQGKRRKLQKGGKGREYLLA